LDSLLTDYGRCSVVAVRYHGDTPWEFDPFYNANPGEVDERLAYYSVASPPVTIIDGSPLPRTCFVTKVKDAIEEALDVPSPVKLVASDTRVGDSCFVAVRVIAEGSVGAVSLVLRAAVIEDSIHYEAPNGMSLFNNVFRRFLPSHAGVAFEISQGETLDFDLAFEMDPGWNADHVSTVVFCQDDTDGTVIQAASTTPRPPVWGRYSAVQRGRVMLPGNEASFSGTFTNLGASTDTFDLDLASGLPADWSAGFETAGGTEAGDAMILESDSSFAIVVSIRSGLAPGTGECLMTITSRRDPSFSRSLRFFAVSGVCALVVDDDGGMDLESYYAASLDSLGVLWGRWDRSIARPSISDLEGAEFVIWFTGSYFPTLDEYDRNLIAAYLDAGGDMLVTGQDIGYALNYVTSEEYSPEAVDFYRTYLHSEWVTSSSLLWDVAGRSGDPVGDGLFFSIEGGDGADNQDYPDVVDAISPASVIFDYSGDPFKHCGIEGITTNEDRELLLSRIIDWFGKTSGAENPPAPAVISLSPNPAVTYLNISFAGKQHRSVVEIFDVCGRRVRMLESVTGEALIWNLADESNRKVAPGVYFVSVSTGDQATCKKVVLTR
jgi:hypothetical protein